MDAITPLPLSEIAHRIRVIRGQRVLLDTDLAAFYGETTKRFNQQVRRNLARLPDDFMFQLDEEEFNSLRLQFATSNVGRGGRRYSPIAFTEHGAIMAATLLNNPRATEISVHVVRAFLEMRALLSSNQTISKKLLSLENKVSQHDRAINELMDSMREPPAKAQPAKRPIGFVYPKEARVTSKKTTK